MSNKLDQSIMREKRNDLEGLCMAVLRVDVPPLVVPAAKRLE